ncbi:MOSC domain protein [Tissierellia bacterium KA00581]|jgi:hypothetical protein|nr:MOSC domain protein [Tissierellia bacterium KA00581]
MKVVAVSISEKKGTKKHTVPFVNLIEDFGIEGDAHAGKWHRQVSLLAQESMENMKKKLPTLKAGDFAENILTEGIILYKLPIGTILKIGQCMLEVTQIGKECHFGCEIRHIVGDCVMPREGIFTRVIKGGKIQANDDIEIIEK